MRCARKTPDKVSYPKTSIDPLLQRPCTVFVQGRCSIYKVLERPYETAVVRISLPYTIYKRYPLQGEVKRVYIPEHYLLACDVYPSNTSFSSYSHRFLPRRLKYTYIDYSGIRLVLHGYSAYTTLVFGTSTGVVHAEYWYDMYIFALLSSSDGRIKVHATTYGKAERTISLSVMSLPDTNYTERIIDMIYYGWQGKFITDENTNNNKYAGESIYTKKSPQLRRTTGKHPCGR